VCINRTVWRIRGSKSVLRCIIDGHVSMDNSFKLRSRQYGKFLD